MSLAHLSKDDPSLEEMTVRVKPGVRHLLDNDVPLGGWTGSIQEAGTEEDLGYLDDLQEPGVVYALVEWNDTTLARCPPLLREHLKREGINWQLSRVRLADLEQADDSDVPLDDLPVEFVKAFEDRDRRMRTALELPDEVEFPLEYDEVMASHDRYHAYLLEQLELPCEAVWDDQFGEGESYEDDDFFDEDDKQIDEEHVHGPDCQHGHPSSETSRIQESAEPGQTGHEPHVHGPDCDHGDYELVRRDVTVKGLIPADEVNQLEGIYCQCLEENRPIEPSLIDIDFKDHPANQQLLDDYRYWFHRLGPALLAADEDDDAEDFDSDDNPFYGNIWKRMMEPRTEKDREIMDDLTVPVEQVGDEEPFVRTAAKVGRNDPCPCGSGKKFKKCCLRDQ
ncbi:MAG: SEC-C metal-binding domain-containing protein [Pirellulales bacterium]